MVVMGGGEADDKILLQQWCGWMLTDVSAEQLPRREFECVRGNSLDVE